MSTDRRGFTMLTVLWLMSVCAIAAMAFVLDGRDAVDGGRNRVNLERARWRALGCARRMQAVVDSRLSDARSPEEAARTWRTLERAAVEDPLVSGCDVTLEAAGTRLDINAATSGMMRDILLFAGVRDADSIAEAITRRRGHQPFDDPRELSRELGVDFARIDSLVAVDAGRVSLATAHAPVLALVPGIARETADSLEGRARDGHPVNDLADILGVVSAPAANALLANYPDAVRATTPDPDAWMLRARARSGDHPIQQEIVWRLTRAGYHVQIVDVRMTP